MLYFVGDKHSELYSGDDKGIYWKLKPSRIKQGHSCLQAHADGGKKNHI